MNNALPVVKGSPWPGRPSSDRPKKNKSRTLHSLQSVSFFLVARLVGVTRHPADMMMDTCRWHVSHWFFWQIFTITNRRRIIYLLLRLFCCFRARGMELIDEFIFSAFSSVDFTYPGSFGTSAWLPAWCAPRSWLWCSIFHSLIACSNNGA